MIEIKLNDKSYPLIFTTKAYADICEKFKTYGEFIKTFTHIGDVKYNAQDCNNIAWLIALLANQAILISNYENKEKEPLLDPEYIVLKTKPRDLTDMNLKAIQAITEGWKSQTESEESDEVLDEIKNVKGAEE